MLKLIRKFLNDPFHYLFKISLKYSHFLIPNKLMFRSIKDVDNLNELYNNLKNEDFIISFPLGAPFNFMLQRPQQLAKQFSKTCPVLYYTGCLGYNPDKIHHVYKSIGKLQLINDGLNGNSIFNIENKLHFSYLYLPADHYHYLKKLPENVKIIYDYLDDISLSPRYSEKLIFKHNEILKRANLIITTASKLYDSVPDVFKHKTRLITNGVEFERFNTDHDKFRNNKPVICFYGSLAHWINADIFLDIVNSNKFTLRLIGPVHDAKFQRVINHENTEYLGYVDYHSLIDKTSDVDVFIMPFEINKITMAVSPVKLFEHMATGLPVVSTPIYEVKKYKNVFISDRIGFVEKIEEALDYRYDEAYITLSKKNAFNNSWEKKSTEILDFFNIKNAKA